MITAVVVLDWGFHLRRDGLVDCVYAVDGAGDVSAVDGEEVCGNNSCCGISDMTISFMKFLLLPPTPSAPLKTRFSERTNAPELSWIERTKETRKRRAISVPGPLLPPMATTDSNEGRQSRRRCRIVFSVHVMFPRFDQFERGQPHHDQPKNPKVCGGKNKGRWVSWDLDLGAGFPACSVTVSS